MAPQLEQVRRPVSRRNISLYSTQRCISTGRKFRPENHCAKPSACGIVLGKPSSRKPVSQSGHPRRSQTIRLTRSSGASCPAARMLCISRPSEVFRVICSRSKSPVARCGQPVSLVNILPVVPLPEPGAPNNITARGFWRAGFLAISALSVVKEQTSQIRQYCDGHESDRHAA